MNRNWGPGHPSYPAPKLFEPARKLPGGRYGLVRGWCMGPAVLAGCRFVRVLAMVGLRR